MVRKLAEPIPKARVSNGDQAREKQVEDEKQRKKGRKGEDDEPQQKRTKLTTRALENQKKNTTARLPVPTWT